MILPTELYLTLIDHGPAIGVGSPDFTRHPGDAADQAGEAYEDGSEFTVLRIDTLSHVSTDVTAEITAIIEKRLKERHFGEDEPEPDYDDGFWREAV